LIRHVIAMGLLLAFPLGSQARAAEAWFPLEVDVWTPPFNTERKTERRTYAALERVSRKWNVCVAIPHLKDAYWLAVNYGLIAEARRLNIRMTVYEAGGYARLDRQREQIVECMDEPADALIVSAVSADGLNDLVERYAAKGRPVIDLINGITSPSITARAAADFAEMARLTGDYLRRMVAGPGHPVRIAWFPGPEGAGWSKAGDAGLRASLVGTNIEIAAVGWGDTALASQTRLVSAALTAHPDLAFIVGTSVTAEAAIQEIRRQRKEGQVRVLAYYFSPSVHRAIARDSVVAAPSDVPTLQARLSVDLAVRSLEKLPLTRHLAAPIQMLDAASLSSADLSASLAPGGFRAILTVGR
jgi:protein TorT